MTAPRSEPARRAAGDASAPTTKHGHGQFLDEVVRTVEEELRFGLYARRPSREEVSPGPRRPLREALRANAHGPALIVELKHASPGHQEERLTTLPPDRFAHLCESAGASALSVIPQPFAFGGSLEEFAKVTRASKLPVLFKDFILDEAQIRAAALHGASGVLLLARLARAGSLHAPLPRLVEIAHEHRLEALIEVHDPIEVPIALKSGADILGVNSRDLGTLELRPREAVRVLRTLRKDPRPLVAMSGVKGRAEVELYARAGADAVLLGTAFSKAHDPSAFLRSLRAHHAPPSTPGGAPGP